MTYPLYCVKISCFLINNSWDKRCSALLSKCPLYITTGTMTYKRTYFSSNNTCVCFISAFTVLGCNTAVLQGVVVDWICTNCIDILMWIYWNPTTILQFNKMKCQRSSQTKSTQNPHTCVLVSASIKVVVNPVSQFSFTSYAAGDLAGECFVLNFTIVWTYYRS